MPVCLVPGQALLAAARGGNSRGTGSGTIRTFWHILIWTCVAWYSSVTILVAVRGWRDIVNMLKRLGEEEREDE